MKISLSEQEVSTILLEHVNAKMGINLNTVSFDTCYSSLREVVLTFEKPTQMEAVPEAA